MAARQHSCCIVWPQLMQLSLLVSRLDRRIKSHLEAGHYLSVLPTPFYRSGFVSPRLITLASHSSNELL